MAINLYDDHDEERRTAAHAAYISAPEYPALASEASKRGYRHAELNEIHASANALHWAPDLHCWRGDLWVRIA